MATEIAAAYVTLIPSLRGAQSSITRQLSGMDLSGAGSAMGNSLSKGFGSGLKGLSKSLDSMGSKLYGAASMVAKPAVGAITAIGGSLVALAAQGGLTRALNLEAAQSMFSGLGLEWQTYKGVVQDAVDGTIFTLGEAAIMAANLAASGIEDVGDMEKALNGATGIASTFGASLSDIGNIYQKVAAQGKLTGDTIFQLTTRGVNATNILTDYLGVTSDELSDMVRKGEIDFDTFSNAMYDAFGTAAQGANETFSGSMANMRNALNRIGEDFMTPIVKNAVPVFNAIRVAINDIRKLLSPLATEFGAFVETWSARAVQGIEAFSAKLAETQGYYNGAMDEFVQEPPDFLGAIAAGIDAAFGEGTAEKIEQVASAIATVGAAGAALKGAAAGMELMGAVIDGLEGAEEKLNGVANGAKRAVTVIKSVRAGLSEGVNEGLMLGVQDLKNTILQSTKVRPKVEKFVGALGIMGKQTKNIGWAFGELGSATHKALTPLRVTGTVANKLGSAFLATGKVVGKGAMMAAGALGGVAVEALALGAAAAMGNADLQEMADGVLANMQALTEGVGPMADQIVDLLPSFTEQAAAALPGLVGAIAEALSTITEALPEILPAMVEAITELVNELAPMIVQMAPLILQAGMQLFTALVQALAQTAPQIIAQLPALITGLLNALLANLPALIAASLQLFFGILIALAQATPQIVSALIAFLPQLGQIIVQMAPLILQAGVQLFKAIGEALVQVIPMIAQALWDFVTHLPEIIVNGVGGMVDAGVQFFNGFIDGLMGGGSGATDAAIASVNDAVSAGSYAAEGAYAVGDAYTASWMEGYDFGSAEEAATAGVDDVIAAATAHADGSQIGVEMVDSATAAAQAAEFTEFAVGMVEGAVSAAKEVDVSSVGSNFAEQAAAGIDAEAMSAKAQEMVANAVSSAQVESTIDVAVDISGIEQVESAAYSAADALSSLASLISSSMAIAAESAASAGNSIKSALDIPDKTVRVNVSRGYVQLPHFSISGEFNLQSKSVPTVGVSWWSKGGLFTRPAVIGVGEGSEPEGVFPLSRLEEMMSGGGGDTNYYITLAYDASADANDLARGVTRELRLRNLMGA